MLGYMTKGNKIANRIKVANQLALKILSWVNPVLTMRVLKSGRGQRRENHTEGSNGLTLAEVATLKLEEGAASQGCRQPLEVGKRKKRFSPGTSRRNAALSTP